MNVQNQVIWDIGCYVNRVTVLLVEDWKEIDRACDPTWIQKTDCGGIFKHSLIWNAVEKLKLKRSKQETQLPRVPIGNQCSR